MSLQKPIAAYFAAHEAFAELKVVGYQCIWHMPSKAADVGRVLQRTQATDDFGPKAAV
jgi:hypothetical protein